MRATMPVRMPGMRHYFSMPAEFPFDRCDSERRSPAWVDELRAADTARAMTVWRGKFLVPKAKMASLDAGNSMGRVTAPLLWSTPHEEGKSTWQSTRTAKNTFLLGVDGKKAPYFVTLWPSAIGDDKLEEGNFTTVEARRVLMGLGEDQAGAQAALACHGYTVANWHDSALFCGHCGSPTDPEKGGASRKCRNSPTCGKQVFPRTNPVAIMAVVSPDGNKMLLGQTKIRHTTNMYSVLAGFIDHSESLEEAVRREVAEEAGIKVGEVLYHSSQPWPWPGNLMLGCIAKATSTDIKADPEEMADVRWFSRDEVRKAIESFPNGEIVLPPKTAIAHHLVMDWLDRELPSGETERAAEEARHSRL